MDKVWLQYYPTPTAHEIDFGELKNINDFIAKSVKKYQNLPAFKNFGTIKTFQEIDQLSNQFAAYLQSSLRLKKGDRVAIMMPSLLQYPVVIFAIIRVGLIVVNINPLYTPDELTYQVNDAGAETIIVLENFAATVASAKRKTNLKNIIITTMGDLLGFPKGPLLNFVVKRIKKLVPPYQLPDAIKFKKAMQLGSRLSIKPVDITMDDIAFLQYTGGTTGISKGAVLTHKNIIANVLQAGESFKAIPGNLTNPLTYNPLPPYHIFSLIIIFIIFGLGGLDVLITNPRDIPHLIKELKKIPPEVLLGVNTLFKAMMNDPHFKEIDFSKARLILGGAMPIQSATAKKWKELTGTNLLEGYGLTEASPVVSINPLNRDYYSGTIGFPISSTDVKVCDDNGNELPLNTVGELYVKGPQVMRGYWNRPEETSNVLVNGWLKTGDMVTINEKGELTLVDRKKDMINISGFKVYPNEVEDVIAHYPGVAEVGVIGVKRNDGEIVKAFIVKKDPNLSIKEIIDYCHQHLTNYKVPKEIEFIKELPKTNVGKVLRRALNK